MWGQPPSAVQSLRCLGGCPPISALAFAGGGPKQKAACGNSTNPDAGSLHRGAHFGMALADDLRFRKRVIPVQSGGLERLLQNLGDVQGMASGALGDLLAATESVGDDEP